MFKFFFKGIIFILGIQSLFIKLQQQNIIEGSIQVNYPILIEKVNSVLKSDEVRNVIDQLQNDETLPEQPERGYEINQVNNDSYENCEAEYNNAERPVRTRYFEHTIQPGETLSQLSEAYGVAWQVIKKANHITDERRLRIGQTVIIPEIERRLG